MDVACGTGHSTFYLRTHFKQCLGFDISEAKVACAKQKGRELNARNVEFKAVSANSLPLGDGSVDLVSCAEAWHWLEPEVFYREVGRVLRPGGCRAVYGYRDPTILNQECDDLLSVFRFKTLKGYDHERNEHLENLYSEVRLAYPNLVRFDLPTEMSYTMELSDIIGYISSWSGYQTYCEKTPGNSVLEELQQNMESALKAAVSQSDSSSTAEEPSHSDCSSLKVDVVIPLFGQLGQKPN